MQVPFNLPHLISPGRYSPISPVRLRNPFPTLETYKLRYQESLPYFLEQAYLPNPGYIRVPKLNMRTANIQTYLYFSDTNVKFCSQCDFLFAAWILRVSEHSFKRRLLIRSEFCSFLSRGIHGRWIKVKSVWKEIWIKRKQNTH